MNATQTSKATIIDVGTPVQVPPAAPVAVRAAALAAAYCIEVMAFGYKAEDGEALQEADKCLTAYRTIIEKNGWRLEGIVALDDGSKGWALWPA